MLPNFYFVFLLKGTWSGIWTGQSGDSFVSAALCLGPQLESWEGWGLTAGICCPWAGASSLTRLGRLPSVGWTLDGVVNQDTYMWPLHVTALELPQSVAAGI